MHISLSIAVYQASRETWICFMDLLRPNARRMLYPHTITIIQMGVDNLWIGIAVMGWAKEVRQRITIFDNFGVHVMFTEGHYCGSEAVDPADWCREHSAEAAVCVPIVLDDAVVFDDLIWSKDIITWDVDSKRYSYCCCSGGRCCKYTNIQDITWHFMKDMLYFLKTQANT